MTQAATQETGHTETRLGYRPGLDGIRAIAIACVVGYHAFRVPADGWLGVDLFFVLSGFLITTLLLEEHLTAGRVSLRAFYRRRAYRLLPALFVLLGVLALVWIVGGRMTSSRMASLAEGLGYVMNLTLPGWFGHVVTSVSHLWSLALEEQFYLVWPVLFFVFLRGHRKLALLVIVPTLMFVTANGAARIGGDGHRVLFAPDTRSVGILVGCATAIALSLWPNAVRRAGRLLLPVAFVIAASLTFLSTGLGIFRGLLVVYAACCALLIVTALSPGVFTSILSLPPVTYLGRISYSLYLWHIPVLVAFGVIGEPVFPAQSLVVRIAAVTCSVLAAAASYHFVEQPFVRRRHRVRESFVAVPVPS